MTSYIGSTCRTDHTAFTPLTFTLQSPQKLWSCNYKLLQQFFTSRSVLPGGPTRGILNPSACLGSVLDGEAGGRKRLVLRPPTPLPGHVGSKSRTRLSAAHDWLIGNMFCRHHIFTTSRCLLATSRVCDTKYVNAVAGAIPLNCFGSVSFQTSTLRHASSAHAYGSFACDAHSGNCFFSLVCRSRFLGSVQMFW